MKRRGPRPSKTRIVGYHYGWDGLDFDESPMERVLGKAKAAGVVSEFDTGRGNLVWFEGPPGKALRAVRTQVLALLAEAS